ncbi:MAG TPA: helix-turn-helix domain-containing protein [Daejeonella sp.]
MEVICLEEAAFYTLIEEVVKRLKGGEATASKQWVNGEEAMSLLNIKSKTTLQNLRDTGKIRFSQPQKRVILYDYSSILEYLNRNARETF